MIGLGVLGAAALRQAARDGARVLGIEQHEPGHDRGSSHGRSRALRFVYHAPDYVALLPAAVEGWRALEAKSGRRLYWNCGTLFFARPGNATFDRNVAIMAAAGVPHILLDEAAARRRFPGLALTPGSVGVLNHDGGMVDADASVAAFVSGARLAGAELRTRTRVVRLDLDGERPRIVTDRGVVIARHVVIAAGAWTNRLLPDLRLPIRVTRQHWFTMRPASMAPLGPDHLPVWADYDTMSYGFPDHGWGMKVAHDVPGPEVDPDAAVRPQVSGEEERRMTAYVRERFPETVLTLDDVGTCLYTLTPDDDFLLGTVPGSGGTASLVVGLSHAFKFAPVIGRILADLASTGTTSHRIDRFRIDRFAPAPAG